MDFSRDLGGGLGGLGLAVDIFTVAIMAELTVLTRPRAAIEAAEREEMYALYSRHYASVNLARFTADFMAKDWVFSLHAGAQLAGFSTLATREVCHDGQSLLELFSGDTIIDPAYWGSQGLTRGFAHLAGRLARQHQPWPVYWLLISKGYRTWRYLPTFAQEYWPHPHQQTPPAMQSLLETLASQRFGADFEAGSGVLHFPESQGHLQAALATVRADLAQRPEIQFFLTRNPGYAQGDELVCLTRLASDNLRGPVLRAFVQGWQQAE